MGQIKLLDRNMINMIAAGEVIERPASVVKELLENSIDAGASKISVAIEDGGRKLISVTDNGGGMDSADLALAFEPHATSKVATSNDLHNIATLGFRGEALASIASVSQVRAVSRVKSAQGGFCLNIDCGEKSDVSPSSADYGTTIEVRNLFYKLPARRKFLKSANTEFSHITEQFIRLALANDNLDLTLTHNNKEIYKLSVGNTIQNRIAELFSTDIADHLLETKTEEKGLSVFALLGTPALSRTNNRLQYVFLNKRFINDKFISHAIKEAYRGSFDPGRFPVVFLFISMPYEDYDVNVHPTKIEVRFFNSNLVHSQILACLREKLMSTNLDVSIQPPMPSPQKSFSPSMGTNIRAEKINDAMADFFKKYRTPQTQRSIDFKDHTPAYIPPSAKSSESFAEKAKVLQIHDSFIIAETHEGFIIIDQHALHERILYEQLRSRIQNGRLQSQKLLIPETLEITTQQSDALDIHRDIIEKLGIELTPFGPRTVAIQAFPTLLDKVSPLDFVRDMLDLLLDKDISSEADRLLDSVLNMAACKAAIKAGQKLTNSEIEQLLSQRKITDNSSRCPHGRPTVITFTTAEIEKQFKRT